MSAEVRHPSALHLRAPHKNKDSTTTSVPNRIFQYDKTLQ